MCCESCDFCVMIVSSSSGVCLNAQTYCYQSLWPTTEKQKQQHGNANEETIKETRSLVSPAMDLNIDQMKQREDEHGPSVWLAEQRAVYRRNELHRDHQIERSSLGSTTHRCRLVYRLCSLSLPKRRHQQWMNGGGKDVIKVVPSHLLQH